MGGIGVSSLIALVVLFVLVAPAVQKVMQVQRRQLLIRRLERKRGSRVIVMIHRQESVSYFGIPLARYINIEDSEQILRAIRLTSPETPIDIVLHTPGGLVLAAGQIAQALVRHRGPVTVMVPHYAMSGGTMMALAADHILMDPNAVLGPVDPQLGGFPAASILEVVARKPAVSISDDTLILADIAVKALRQVKGTITSLMLANGMAPERAGELADVLSSGYWTHDYPISVREARQLGLPVEENVPEEVYDLMELYAQPPARRPSVEYIPIPYPRVPEIEPERRSER